MMHSTFFASLILTISLAGQALAADPVVVRLWPGDPPATQPYDATDQRIPRKDDPTIFNIAGIQMPSMAVYLPAQGSGPWPAAIICPGGGYSAESVFPEGKFVADRLNQHGIVAFVLRYRLPDGHPPAEGQLPVPQQDVLRAIQIVRSRAAEWNLDPKRIGVLGFSAGGHLAASAATMFDDAKTFSDKAGNDAIASVSARPDFAVLLYPVISMGASAHTGSKLHLLGANPDATLIARFSADQRVTAATPPLFVVQAEDDKTVPVINSVLMAQAAAGAKVPCELILLQSGGHGFGLGKPGTEAATWFDRMIDWMSVRGVLTAGK